MKFLVFVRSDPFLVERVEIADRGKIVVWYIHSGLCDVEEEVGGVDVGLSGGRIRSEVRNGASSRSEVDLLSTSLEKQDIVEYAEGLGRLYRPGNGQHY